MATKKATPKKGASKKKAQKKGSSKKKAQPSELNSAAESSSQEEQTVTAAPTQSNNSENETSADVTNTSQPIELDSETKEQEAEVTPAASDSNNTGAIIRRHKKDNEQPAQPDVDVTVDGPVEDSLVRRFKRTAHVLKDFVNKSSNAHDNQIKEFLNSEKEGLGIDLAYNRETRTLTGRLGEIATLTTVLKTK